MSQENLTLEVALWKLSRWTENESKPTTVAEHFLSSLHNITHAMELITVKNYFQAETLTESPGKLY